MDEKERREIEWDVIGGMLFLEPAFEIGVMCLENTMFHDEQTKAIHKALTLIYDGKREVTLDELRISLEEIGHPELADIDILRNAMRRTHVGLREDFLRAIKRLVEAHERERGR